MTGLPSKGKCGRQTAVWLLVPEAEDVSQSVDEGFSHGHDSFNPSIRYDACTSLGSLDDALPSDVPPVPWLACRAVFRHNLTEFVSWFRWLA